MIAMLSAAILAIFLLLILVGVAWYWLIIGALVILIAALMVFVASIDLWRP